MKQLKLAFIGAQSPEKLKDPETVAANLIKEILKKDKKLVEKLYQIKISKKVFSDPSQVVMLIGKRLGYLKKGGEIEEVKASIRIIKDWQSGKLNIH